MAKRSLIQFIVHGNFWVAGIAALDESFVHSSAGQYLMRVQVPQMDLRKPSSAALAADASSHSNIVLTYDEGNESDLHISDESGVNVSSARHGTARIALRNLSENVTEAVVYQAIISMRWRYEALAALMASTSCAVAAIVASALLILSHVQVGSRLTGLYTPHSSSAAYISLFWSVPIFALLGLAGIILPELQPIWQFLETLLLAGSFSRMPDIFMQVVGGRLQLQLRLNSQATSTTSHDILQTHMSEGEARGTAAAHFSPQWPLFLPPRAVQPQHLAPLHFTVTLICYALPIMSFMKLFWSLEVEIGSASTQEWFAFCAPWVIVTMRLLEMLSIASGLSALNGLETIVTTLSPETASAMELPFKLLYCQAYLMGLRLIPIAFGLIPLWGFSEVPEPRVLEAVRSVIVCFASLVCTYLAWHAFPADERHYPELKAASSEIRPVLDQVKFCPFCGSDRLELNVQSPGVQSVFCRRCCAYDVPLHLVIARGSLHKRTAQSSREDDGRGLAS